MKKYLLLLFLASTAHAWTVSVGTWVCNPDASVAVPVEIDDAAGLAYVAVRVNYDPQVLVCLGIERGGLEEAFDGDFLAKDDEAGSLSVARFRASDGVAGSGGGVLARAVFAVRPGTARQYSDLAVADVRVGDDTGVRDLAVDAPVTPESGMVRIFGAGDAASRLEGRQTVVARTRLASLSLAAGDAIQASDDGTPIVVSGDTSAAAPIPVAEPEGGWTDGTYTLLSTRSAGLSFVAATNETETLDVEETVEEGGVHVYSLAVSVGSVEIVSSEEGEELGKAAANYVASFFAGSSKATTRVVVSGGENNVLLARGLGIRPAIAKTSANEATADFRAPSLEITAFDPATGVVKARVTPGSGNTIEGSLVKGVVRLRGGAAPAALTNIAQKAFTVNDDGYLESTTKGEFRVDADLDFGPAAFFRIAVTTDEAE